MTDKECFSNQCLRCGRILKDKESQKRMYGPQCFKKAHSKYKQLSLFSREVKKDDIR